MSQGGTALNEPLGQERTPPLGSVRLTNFKSVANADVELRPITAIVGRNSSGKSTLLQAILALAQSVQQEEATASFPLNGRLVRLGTFSEVRNFQAMDEAEVGIGFTVSARLSRGRGFRGTEFHSAIDWSAHLSAPADRNGGFARLDGFEFRMQASGSDDLLSSVSLDISRIAGEASAAASSEGGFRFGRIGEVKLAVEGRLTDLRSGHTSRIDHLDVLGGLPLAAYREETAFGTYSRLWWDAFQEALSEVIDEEKLHWAEQRERLDEPRPSRAAVRQATKDLRDLVSELGSRSVELLGQLAGGPGGRGEARFFRACAQQMPSRTRRSVAYSIVGLGEATFRQLLRKALKDEAWLDTPTFEEPNGDLRFDLFQATRAVTDLLRGLRYLGPLRESPQVLYNPASSTDLGVRGEFAAAVLHAQGRHRVRVPLPDGRTDRISLGEALDLWLAHLGLAHHATATDRGRLGMGLTVRALGSDRDVDLTSVGVGVSQALPVVLLCLLVPPGTVILLEQPELHLHPAMQLRLADFLLAIAKSGRQVLVETHSEHLINRLRFRVADDSTEATSQLVGLLFAEQEDGNTSYRPSVINAFGGLEDDWPRGFLDVAAEEAAQFLRATLAKKRAGFPTAD